MLDAEAEFQRSVERVSSEIMRRFNLPVYGLHGARGVYAANKTVERAEFRDYVESRDLRKEFVGVRGFGFIAHVVRSELDAFIANERADEAPHFSLRHLNDTTLNDLYIIKFIEPAADNIGSEGLDVGSEPVRREALLRAIDSGNPTITAAINLVQDQTKRPGVLLFVPMYAKGARPTTVEERRAVLVGVLFAPIVIAELLDKMPEVMEGRADFDLYDGVPGSPGSRLVFDPDQHSSQNGNSAEAPVGRRFSRLELLPLAGRNYSIRVNSTPRFDAAIDQLRPWLIFIFGAMVSALFAMLVRQQISYRHRAELLAQQMTEQLRKDQERSRDFSMSASDWFWESDAQHRFCYFSDNFEAVYGIAPSQLLGRSRKELLDQNTLNQPEMVAAHLIQLAACKPFKNFEYRIQIDSIGIRWISVSGLPHFDQHGQFAGYRGTGSLITERKDVEERIQQQNHMLSTIIDNFPGGISMFDADLRLAAHNEQFKKLLDFPDSLFEKESVQFEDLIRLNAERGEYGPGHAEQQVAAAVARARNFQPHKIERVRPNGTALEIRGVALPGGGFVSIYLDITERKKMEEQVRQMAFYDPLTKLANRRLLNDRLGLSMAASKRSGRYAAVMFLDLDNFKPLNDLHGHETGDLLLIEVANRLTRCVREIDTVARFGGDEFVVVLDDLYADRSESHLQAHTIAEKIRATLSETYRLTIQHGDSSDITVTHECAASIGVVLFMNHEGSGEDILKWADAAMYQAKATGRNTVVFHAETESLGA